MEELEEEYSEELYQKNILENDFSQKEQDGIGDINGTN